MTESYGFEPVLSQRLQRTLVAPEVGAAGEQDLVLAPLNGDLKKAGIKLTEHSPGWGGWRGQDDEILAALFPYEEAPEE